MTEKVVRGSGNIFANIGDPEPERTLARAQIMSRIADIIEQRGLTQAQAAKILGIPQPRVSNLMSEKLSMFSLDHLFQLLNALDRDIEIVIKPRRRNSKQPRIRVVSKQARRRVPA